MSGWESCFRKPQPTYCKGYTQRNPKVLSVSGVNIPESSKQGYIESFEIASQRFNTARLQPGYFIENFIKGEDPLTPIISTMSSNMQLIPILFSGLREGRSIKGLQELGLIDEWVKYVLSFEKYCYCIDVCNEPMVLANPWQKDFVSNMLKRIARLTKVPACVGFHRDTPKSFIEEIEPLCDYMTFHYYNPHPDTFIEGIREYLEYYKSFGKPVLITEFGRKTKSEKEQACWLANILNEIKEADIEGYCVFKLRGDTLPEEHGIYRRDWTPKKCVELFP